MLDNKGLIISEEANLLEAMEMMDITKRKLLIVVNSAGLFHGLISAGDVQRAIIRAPLTDKVKSVLRRDFKVAHVDDDRIWIVSGLLIMKTPIFLWNKIISFLIMDIFGERQHGRDVGISLILK
jgi:CBS domain-containing protein